MAATDLLTSAEVARRAGVGPTAIKRWADLGRLPCLRTAGGHRRFRREDVERFLAEMDGPGAGEWNDWIRVLLDAPDAHAVQARLLLERSRRGSWAAVAEAMGGLLAEIGRRWETGQLTVFEEHTASALLGRGLAAVVETIPTALGAPRCLLATAEGEEHTLGLSLVELCLREAGWRSEWIGAHTRAEDVIGRISRDGVAMVALSASSAATDPDVLRTEADRVGEACRRAGIVLVLGGGGAWPESPSYGRRFLTLETLRTHLIALGDHLPSR